MGHVEHDKELCSLGCSTDPTRDRDGTRCIETSRPVKIKGPKTLYECPPSQSWAFFLASINNASLPKPYVDKLMLYFDQMLYNEGPLPECWRFYIAIMAMCRHELGWVVRCLSSEFIKREGPKTWLCGISFIPPKLKSLLKLNNLLAHRPWMLTAAHIQELKQGDESWSLSELCHAVCILTHFHALASFLHVVLPNPPSVASVATPLSPPSKEPNFDTKYNTQNTTKSENTESSFLPKMNSNSQILTMKDTNTSFNFELNSSLNFTLSNSTSSSSCSSQFSSPNKENSPHKDDPTKTVSKTDPISLLVKTSSDISFSLPTASDHVVSPSCSTSLSTATLNANYLSESKKSEEKNKGLSEAHSTKREIQTLSLPNKLSRSEDVGVASPRKWACRFREYARLCLDDPQWTKEPANTTHKLNIRDFNWPAHGFSLLSRILPQMSLLIDEKQIAANLILNNDLPLKKAIINYAQSLFGIIHENYNYGQIDVKLSLEKQKFISCSLTRPEDVWDEAAPSWVVKAKKEEQESRRELICLSVLVMESRMETEMLFALRAIMNHQRS